MRLQTPQDTTEVAADTLDVLPATPGPEPGAPGVATDTLDVPLDSAAVSPDSLAILPDSLVRDSLAVADTLEAEEFVPRNLPSRATPFPASWSTGVWEWDREALRSTRALTLLELLEEVPGVIALRGGDFGQPSAVTAFGAGAGRVRIFFDGLEMPPLDGGVVDLARIGLAGLDRVYVERRLGELRVDLRPHQFSDPRPYSFLEVGTGDLNTNLFRGVFGHPNALGGNVMLALDRIDTQGPRAAEAGVSFGVLLRHALFRGERLAAAWELRRMTSLRPEDIWRPAGLERTDWAVRGQYEWASWLRFGAFLQRSSLGIDTGETVDPMDSLLVNPESRTQLGANFALVGDSWWVDGEYRSQGGPGWPGSVAALRGGGAMERLGGASVSIERQSWEGGFSGTNFHGRAWTRPLVGVTLFGEFESGGVGVPFWVPPEVPEDSVAMTNSRQGPRDSPLFQTIPDTGAPVAASFTDRTGTRAGVEYRRGGLLMGAALLSIESDSLQPLGLPTDRAGPVTPGGSRTGFELSTNIPLGWLLNGLSAVGSAQFWDQTQTWRYLPERTYQARIVFHDQFFESDNLEVWADVGAKGRDPMMVPSEAPATLDAVPFYQSWFGRLQLRVASVRLFLRWDNFTLRAKNQDYPGRILPQTRAMYGIR